MHIISFRRLREFFAVHPDAEDPLRRWFKLAEKAGWTDFSDPKDSCPSADRVEHLIVVNIGGNKYRLIIEVSSQDQVVLIRHVLTHKMYDIGKWKNQPPTRKKEEAQHGDSTEKKAKAERTAEDRDGGSRR